MTGMPRETPQPRTAFVKSYDRPSTLLLRIPRPGRATVAGLGGTCSHDTPFSLVYVLRGDDVEVVAVAHGRRRPGYWRSRL
jgi:hypothetical protein